MDTNQQHAYTHTNSLSLSPCLPQATKIRCFCSSCTTWCGFIGRNAYNGPDPKHAITPKCQEIFQESCPTSRKNGIKGNGFFQLKFLFEFFLVKISTIKIPYPFFLLFKLLLLFLIKDKILLDKNIRWNIYQI